MTYTRETNYICTPYFCRRNVIGLYPVGDFAENPIIIPAEHYDFFSVVMGSVINGYTLFDDRYISFEDWSSFLFTASEYLSIESYDELAQFAEDYPPLKYWLRINGDIFWSHVETYRTILSLLISWTAENVNESGISVKGI